MLQVSDKERKLTIITRYVCEKMITDLYNHDSTLEDFIRKSYAGNKEFDYIDGSFNIPIKIYIPESEE